MQESLIGYKGLVCDYCGKPSSNHVYHQIWVDDAWRKGLSRDIYLCGKCYKERKAKRHV